MVNIKNILYLILLLTIISSANADIKPPFDNDDFGKCLEKNGNIQNLSSMTTKTCTSLNSSFKNENDKCCRITINYDTLKQLKQNFGEDWKKRAAQMYGFDENLSEKEIREKYVPIKKQYLCGLITGDEDYNSYYLYGNSLYSYDGKATYDCGNGEKSFDGKTYSPKQQIYKQFKDIFDCQIQTTESDCHKSASKFLSNGVIACWNKVNKYEGFPDSEECKAYLMSEYKSEFKSKYQYYLSRRDKIEETWNCRDKSGTNIQIYMNTFTGKFNIN